MIEFPGKRLLRRVLSTMARHRARCLFVLSTGRVGTVTLTHLLNLSPAVRATHEPGPQFLAESQSAYRDHPLQARRRVALFRLYAESRVRDLVRASAASRYYAECSNRLTFLAPALAEHLPKARFLHLHRDPAGVVRSGMRREWYRNHPWDPLRIAPRPSDSWFDEWRGWGPFEKCCWYWSAVNEFCLHVTARLPEDRFLRLDMKALFASDGLAAERLFDWLGVTRPAQPDLLRVIGTRYNAQTENEFPEWARWTAAQREVLKRIAGPVARELGYGSYLMSTGSESPSGS